MFADRLAEGLAFLRVGNCIFKRGAGHADAAGRHIDSLALEPVIICLKPSPSTPPIRLCGRDEKILERQLAILDAAVTERVDLADDAESRSPFFDHEGRNRLA